MGRKYLTVLLGVGLSAKFIEQGGGDLIIVYNSGRFRMAGRGSLAGLMPYGDANAVVLDMVSFESDSSCRRCSIHRSGHPGDLSDLAIKQEASHLLPDSFQSPCFF